MKELNVAFCEPIVNYEGDWFAVCGHLPNKDATESLIENGTLDFVFDDNDDDTDPHSIASDFLGASYHGYVRLANEDDEAPSDTWYYECDEPDEGAIAATIFQA